MPKNVIRHIERHKYADGTTSSTTLFYGWVCAERLGLIAVTKRSAAGRTRKLSKIILKKIFVQDGQESLFEAGA